MARRAVLPDDGAALAIPESAGPAVNANLPIAVRWAMATAAQAAALRQLERLAFMRSEQLKIFWVMAVETIVVSIAASVPQHEITVGLGQDHVSIRVVVDSDRLLVVVARVAGHSRSVATGANEFGGGHPNGRRIGEFRGGGRIRRERGRAAPQIEAESRCQAEEGDCQGGQDEGLVGVCVHRLRMNAEPSSAMRLTTGCSILHLFLIVEEQPMGSQDLARKTAGRVVGLPRGLCRALPRHRCATAPLDNAGRGNWPGAIS